MVLFCFKKVLSRFCCGFVKGFFLIGLLKVFLKVFLMAYQLFLFNGRNNHQQASTPPREPSGSSTSGPPSLPRVQKRLELSPLPHPQHHHHHPHHQGHGGHTSGGKMPLNLQGGVTVGHPRMRTDPGAPPGCTEHSLNILGGHYLLLDHLEGSHLQRCIDVNTKQEYVCKVRIEFFIPT